jgi:sec-independent protein translocase protein TatC
MTTENRQAEDIIKEQSFVSHLMELRDRMLRMVVVVLLVFLCLFPFANEIYVLIASPLMAHLPQGAGMIATKVASPFLTPFKLSLVVAIFLSMPFILHQFWGFVAPGLYKHEKRMAMPLLASSTLLFYSGIVFAYYAVFPLVFAFLSSTVPEGVTVATDIAEYLDFVLTLFFAFGLAFEVPIATIILVWMGVTTPESLLEKRPYIIVGAFCIGMLLTPPDVISQVLLALPMWLLFEVGVVFSRVIVREKALREAAEDSAEEYNAGDSVQTVSGSVAASPAREDVIAGFQGDPSPEEGESAIDEERYTSLTEEELEAELDEIEAEMEQLPGNDVEDTVTEKLREVNRLRDEEDIAGARKLLYEVLAEGDDEQIFVARNILAQLDGE